MGKAFGGGSLSRGIKLGCGWILRRFYDIRCNTRRAQIRTTRKKPISSLWKKERVISFCTFVPHLQCCNLYAHPSHQSRARGKEGQRGLPFRACSLCHLQHKGATGTAIASHRQAQSILYMTPPIASVTGRPVRPQNSRPSGPRP
jgi:hypothetical protein